MLRKMVKLMLVVMMGMMILTGCGSNAEIVEETTEEINVEDVAETVVNGLTNGISEKDSTEYYTDSDGVIHKKGIKKVGPVAVQHETTIDVDSDIMY